jgi:hypothetical protein
MKRTILAMCLTAMLIGSSTSAVFALGVEESSLLTKKQENNLISFFEQRGNLLKDESYKSSGVLFNSAATSLNNKDEALALVTFMDEVHNEDLKDYTTEYTIKDVKVVNGNQVATADLYQSFSWSGSDIVTKFKDEVDITFLSSGDIHIDLPQLELTNDELITNAQIIKAKSKLEFCHHIHIIALRLGHILKLIGTTIIQCISHIQMTALISFHKLFMLAVSQCIFNQTAGIRIRHGIIM